MDKGHVVGAILMDLSFDCMPHDLLIAKFLAYGLNQNSASLLGDYLSNRKQMVKINQITSEWSTIKKGVPQGSILGPLLFNIFLNDLLFYLEKCILYNYADDNSLAYCDPSLEIVQTVLQEESDVAVDWFTKNDMLANTDKFQAIVLGCKN